MARPNVLIVDDDASLAENVGEILAALDVEVLIAPSGGDAERLAAAHDVDLALVDVRLPDGDGTALMARLRARSPLAEVVLITGDATLESAIAAVKGGAFAYLLKPVSPPDLLDTARRALTQVALLRERERLQGELRRSERTHREVVEAVPALVLALDRAGRIRLWNRRLEELTGFPRDEMLGHPGQDLVRGGGVRPLPTRAAGERLVRWERAEVGGTGPDDISTYAVGTDVTAEQEMLRRTLRAERLAAVGTLAAGLAHEVRNPLNSALLQLQVLERRLGRGDAAPASLSPILGAVSDEIHRLEHLVNDFLAFVRPRPLEVRPAALADLCQGVVAFIGPEAEAARVRLHVDLPADLVAVPMDAERMRQVLLNLVRNAVEAMPEGGDLTLRARNLPGTVEIDVEDTGQGFPDETPIFDAFFTTKSKGTGLGLTIVHRIVTDHGGTIRVRSRPGATCFTICLPVQARGS
jgi:signal transduction histidine kinase